jgi:hypothetical protein
VVQYNLEGHAPYVSTVCDALSNETAAPTPLDGLAAATALFSTDPLAPSCVPSSWTEDNVGGLTNVTFDGKSSMRQWIWQSCNEFGFFQTTTGPAHPFTAFDQVDVHKAGLLLCQQAYGLPASYTGPDTAAANTNYGARDMQGSNIAMVNGNMDPWHALGVVNASDPFYESCNDEAGCADQAVAPTSAVVTIDGTAHCRDMYAPGLLTPYGIPDTPSVVWAHAKVVDMVAGYLA